LAEEEVEGISEERLCLKLVNMSKPIKTIEIKPNQKREGKAFGCSEIFTLNDKGKVIKKE
jgi:hypothetical protein